MCTEVLEATGLLEGPKRSVEGYEKARKGSEPNLTIR
jgi:hypothetical protein